MEDMIVATSIQFDISYKIIKISFGRPRLRGDKKEWNKNLLLQICEYLKKLWGQ
jgi:hypothetical protein